MSRLQVLACSLVTFVTGGFVRLQVRQDTVTYRDPCHVNKGGAVPFYDPLETRWQCFFHPAHRLVW